MTEQRGTAGIAQALGAILRGAREGDAAIRKRFKGFLSWLAGGGFAIYVALRLLSTLETHVVRLSDSVDNLIWTLWETNANQEQRTIAMMRAMKVAIPPPVHRPNPGPPADQRRREP